MTATVTISIEIELGWGVHDLQRYDHLSERGQAERRYLRKLLDACDAHRIPVSFDVVGHLFLESAPDRIPDRTPTGGSTRIPGPTARRIRSFMRPI